MFLSIIFSFHVIYLFLKAGEEMAVGENIRKIRHKKGLTQKQLGELCNMNEANVRKYELGKANPKIETIEKFAKALQCSVDELRGMPKVTDLTTLSIGQLIAKYRAYSEISLEQLADKTNIAINRLQKIEEDKLIPGAELSKIANTLNIPSGELAISILSTESPFEMLNNSENATEILSHIPEYITEPRQKSDKSIQKEITLSDLEHLFNKLNVNGKKELLKRLEELTNLKQYTD